MTDWLSNIVVSPSNVASGFSRTNDAPAEVRLKADATNKPCKKSRRVVVIGHFR